ncbi:hypothetical protein HX071_06565 [Myroides marinus]|uniref:hypothetical protein n=1 Tax=Myroides marinus TaxID=703342 RepID=UPI00257530E8|nr:hypothetical protein [Myroides marinus]MDM1501862.1 hypothetical protein [Myroides marinus]
MKEAKLYYYGASMGRSTLIVGSISVIMGLLLSYFILRDVSLSIELLIEFWQMSLLLLLFIGMGIKLIYSESILFKKYKNKVVLLRLTPDSIINYERNIILKWIDIEDIVYIGFRNKHGIGVKMINEEMLFNQLPIHKRVFYRIFGLGLLDVLSGEYIEGNGKLVQQEIKDYHEQTK